MIGLSTTPTASPRRKLALLPLALALAVGRAAAEDRDAESDSANALKKLSLEQLMDVEVTSVSRRPEPLDQAPSGVQVVTGEDIQRSAATSLPEALRLAPNLQVAQVNASQWAISARGFDNVLANKLLVMIDGRTVYTPLYSGVFWDVQNVMLADVDRIEVVSGPGGTLWGANAVNGVINVISKSAKDTQGLYAEGIEGNEQGAGALRYGGKLAPDLYYRVYGMGFRRDDTINPDGSDGRDGWDMAQGGFRMDWDAPANQHVTLQGDSYDGRPDPDGDKPVVAIGENVLGRWSWAISEEQSCQLQGYVDRTWRDFRNGFTERLDTYDLDWQHRFRLIPRDEVTWGLGYRLMDDREDNLPLFGIFPGDKQLHLYSAFLQDEAELIEHRLKLTVGSKIERNDYTGNEYQPNARVAWTPSDDHLIWAAASRAVRTPSRLEEDFSVSLAPGVAVLAGNPDFESEKVHAYELGWRTRLDRDLSLSLSTFYNEYFDLRTAEPGPPPLGIPIIIGNGLDGHTYGAELAVEARPMPGWRLRGGYTFLRKHLWMVSGSHDANQETAESDDPEHQALLQSMLDLAHGVRFDTVLRYVAPLPKPRVPSYVDLDLRLAFRVASNLEMSLVGQNVIDRSHPEFVASSDSREIERAYYWKIAAWW